MADSSAAQTPPQTNEVYGIFAGVIDQAAVAKIANAAAVTSSNQVTRCHLVMQTMGGSVADGIALHNIFKAFPIPLTLYNVGSIASAGVIAYLGAADRVTHRLATFMIHRTTSPALGMTSDRLRATVRSVELDDVRTEDVFRPLKLSADHRDIHKIADLWLSADEAVDVGIATRIGEFGPPKGTQLFSLSPI